MFDLPFSTTLLVFGFPAFWILYTLVFLLVTRHWEEDSPDEENRP